MEQNPQHLLLLLTFMSIVSVLSLVFIVRTLDKDACFTEKMIYYKMYFALVLFGLSFKFVMVSLNLPGKFILSFVLYILIHTVLLCALENKFCKKWTVYIVGLFISALFMADYIWDYELKEFLAMFVVYNIVIFSALLYVSIGRAIQEKNNGYYIFASAFVIILLSVLIIIISLINENIQLAYTMVTVGNYAGFFLVVIGFLSLTLINEHKKLALLATEDALTGMNNRRGLQVMLDLIVPQANRESKCLSVITIDIDFFKKINDTYGHDGGDRVLQEFAKLIKKAHRGSDVSCRFGGEEFVLVLPDTNKEGADLMAEKLRSKTEEYDIDIENKKINITASFGVATRCSNIDIDAMMKDADKALYSAKFSGRNKVCHIDDEMDSSE